MDELHIQNLSNCCRHNYDQSISQYYGFSFWRIIAICPNCVPPLQLNSTVGDFLEILFTYFHILLMNLDFFMKAPLLSNSIRHTFQIGYLSTYICYS
jgi:hypothetical protein